MGTADDEPSLSDLPTTVWSGLRLREWRGEWLPDHVIKAVREVEADFTPFPTDIILASFPKTGSTWLKALTFAVVHHRRRPKENDDDDPLLTHSPHELVPFLEYDVYGKYEDHLDVSRLPSPRIFLTHLPYHLLPDSIKRSGCKIVYITRNPRDTIVSFWHYWNSHTSCIDKVSLPHFFEGFCGAMTGYGRYFENALSYWREKERLLFVKYEELRKEPTVHVKRLADLLGCPLHSEEVKDVVRRCSIERLSDAEAKRGGRVDVYGYPRGAYFRKGVVGDWENHLTPEMVQRLDAMTENKFKGSGLVL